MALLETLSIQLAEDRLGTITKAELKDMTDYFITGAPLTYGKSHYDLSSETGIVYSKWETFLNNAKVKVFIAEQMQAINTTQARNAMLGLGDAQGSVDIQKAKQFIELQRKDATTEHKPFKMYAMPSEVIKYKNALVQVGDELKKESPSIDAIKSLLAQVGVN